MIPSALLRKMPVQEQECSTAEAGKACIHLLHAAAHGAELEQARLCSLWCLVQEGMMCDAASHLLRPFPSWMVEWRGHKMKVERGGSRRGFPWEFVPRENWQFMKYVLIKESHELPALAPPWCFISGPVCWQVLWWEKKKRYWNLCSPGSPVCSPSSFWSPDGLGWLPSFLLFLIMTGPRGPERRREAWKRIASGKGGQRREEGKEGGRSNGFCSGGESSVRLDICETT